MITTEIPPQGKRKHKIIFRAVFSNDSKEQQEVEEVLANTIGKMGVFDK